MPFVGAYRSMALAGMGMVAATSVPPSGGALDPEAPVERGEPVPEALEAAAVRAGAADAVVAHLDPQRPVLDPRGDRGARGAGVLGDVGERLGDDEVGGRLDRRRQPVDRHVDLDGHRRP